MAFNDLRGRKFGKLTAVERVGSRRRKALWLCRCDCGGSRDIPSDVLVSGRSTSCGCSHYRGRLRHGLSQSTEHKIWCGIHERCSNPNSAFYAYYGGRGIKRCERWDVFENFYADMGPRPSTRHTIDRIDNDGDYSPDNCRWALPTVQAGNTRKNVYFIIGRERLHLSEWARRFSIDPDLVSQRILRDGMEPIEALTRPKRRASV